MTLVGFEPGTPGWQANVLTNTPKISRDFIVTKSQYLNLVQKTGTFLISAHPIVDSDRACLELPRTVFRSYGISKWPRLDSRQMCLDRPCKNAKTLKWKKSIQGIKSCHLEQASRTARIWQFGRPVLGGNFWFPGWIFSNLMFWHSYNELELLHYV